MNSRHMHRVAVRFPRKLDSAFNTPAYASCIEKPWPPLWKRILIALWRWA
jgi:hypothetical protein